MAIRGMGYLRGYKDPRDFPFSALRALRGRLLSMPDEVDFRETDFLPPVMDQGMVGSCTGCAMAYMRAYLEKKQDGLDRLYSPLWIYYKERELWGWEDQDTGAFIRDGFQVMAKQGVALLEDWPYEESKWNILPPDEADEEAMDHQIIRYYSVDVEVPAIKEALAMGFPVVGGWALYESFYDAEVTGLVPMPQPSEQIIGGHAMTLVGYTDHHFIVMNSWGGDWGRDGFALMPFEFCTAYGDDFWTCELVE